MYILIAPTLPDSSILAQSNLYTGLDSLYANHVFFFSFVLHAKILNFFCLDRNKTLDPTNKLNFLLTSLSNVSINPIKPDICTTFCGGK